MGATGPTLRADDVIPGTRYRVVRQLGAGGMGVVYQVVKPPNIQGVLKLMSSELTSHEELLVRFFDEVRILAQLDHPNIVKVFDYDSLEDGTPFYVMELLSGRTVRDVLNTLGRVTPRVAYEITRQLLEAMQCAHTHDVPVIHRDIKPENIFLHAPKHGEPVVKLIDFGVSAVADRHHDDQFVGTWSYAAPEQIRGEKPSPATDIYSAGLVLYEMLAGRGPFDHHVDWPLISEAQLKEIPAPVSKFAPWVPRSIVELIASALEKDPKKRPHDAYAFSERLYDLEWAGDGAKAQELTSEGPIGRRSGAPPEAAPIPPPNPQPGPLSLVLDSVSGVGARRTPSIDRPIAAALPEVVRESPRGDTNALLAGLGADPRTPPSKRSSDPELAPPSSSPSARSDVTPRSGQVVILAGRGSVPPHQAGAPTTPRATRVAPHSSRGPFSSPPLASTHTPPRGLAKERTLGPVAGALAAIVLLAAGVGVAVLLRRPPGPPPASTVTAIATAGATSAATLPTTTAPAAEAAPEPPVISAPASTSASAQTSPSASSSAAAAAAASASASAPGPRRRPSSGATTPSGTSTRGDYMSLP